MVPNRIIHAAQIAGDQTAVCLADLGNDLPSGVVQ